MRPMTEDPMTRSLRAALRRWHPEYRLIFRGNGEVWARPVHAGPGPFGLLYTREQADRAVRALEVPDRR